jgi:UDP-N-acetyl-2-amino-2-deoxyglucuronate dehydrogenase
MAYGFGIVGTGLIGGFHARAIGMVEGARFIGATDLRADALQKFASQHGGKAFPTLADMLKDPDVDVVIICTPSGAHMEPALQAIEAGRHVIIEKPVEVTLARCDAIIEAAVRKNVRTGGIFQSRTLAGSQALKKAVDEGRFGRLTVGDAYVKWFRTQQYYDSIPWRGTMKMDGGGALMNQAIHAIDLLQWLMGPVSEVAAFKGILGHDRIEVEDTAVAALLFANGAMGVIEGSTAIHPGFLKRIEISGTKGSAVLEEEAIKTWAFVDAKPEDDDIRQRLGAAGSSGGGAADPAAIDVRPHAAQIRNFVEALDGKASLLVDAAEGRKAVEIILAIYESAEKKQAVKLGR